MNPSPWHQADQAALARPGHDPATCEHCKVAGSAPYRAGQDAARAAAAAAG